MAPSEPEEFVDSSEEEDISENEDDRKFINDMDEDDAGAVSEKAESDSDNEKRKAGKFFLISQYHQTWKKTI